MAAATRAALHPVLSSPRRLAFMGFGVTVLVYAIQLASGIPPFLSWSPVELSSNVVATMGLAWAAIQLRASRRDASLRRAWLAACGGMALLAIESDVGEVFLLESHGQSEMSLSIALWLLAAALLFATARRFAMRRSVRLVMRLGFAIQLGAQFVGWWTADGGFSHGVAEAYEYLNDTGELVAVLAYLIALLLAVFSANKSYDFPVSAIGRKGREIHRDFRLEWAGRRKAGGCILRLPVLREIAAGALVRRHWLSSAAYAHRAGGPTPARQLFDLLRCGLFERVDAKTYYALELFRTRLVGTAADAVMTRTETGNGLARSIQDTRADLAFPRDLADRVAFARVCEARGLPVVPIFGVAEDGEWRPGADGLAALDRDLIVRARRAGADEAAETFTRVEPMLFRAEDGDLVNLDMLTAHLAARSRDQALVIGPRVANHAAISRYARRAELTFQLVTCLDEHDRPRVTHGVLRIETGAKPGGRNARRARWGSAIDLGAGTFGPLVEDAACGAAAKRHAHPVTEEMIAGRSCAGWGELVRTAVDAHRVFAGHVVIGWDLAWTPDGPRILDGTSDMDFDFIQRCYATPIGHSPLGPLLDAHLDRVVADRT